MKSSVELSQRKLFLIREAWHIIQIYLTAGSLVLFLKQMYPGSVPFSSLYIWLLLMIPSLVYLVWYAWTIRNQSFKLIHSKYQDKDVLHLIDKNRNVTIGLYATQIKKITIINPSKLSFLSGRVVITTQRHNFISVNSLFLNTDVSNKRYTLKNLSYPTTERLVPFFQNYEVPKKILDSIDKIKTKPIKQSIPKGIELVLLFIFWPFVVFLLPFRSKLIRHIFCWPFYSLGSLGDLLDLDKESQFREAVDRLFELSPVVGLILGTVALMGSLAVISIGGLVFVPILFFLDQTGVMILTLTLATPIYVFLLSQYTRLLEKIPFSLQKLKETVVAQQTQK